MDPSSPTQAQQDAVAAHDADMDKRYARIEALGPWQRKMFLCYICGAVPEWVDRALDSAERDRSGGGS